MTAHDFIAILKSHGIAFTNEDGVIAITPSSGGYVDLGSLTTLPENVTFSNGGYVDLRNLTTLPENVTFSNGGNVYLSRLTTLPEGVTFSNGGGVDLRNLTTLPENVTFSNGGYVDLGSLTTEIQVYQGKKIILRNIDGYTMLIGSIRKKGDITIARARYLRGSKAPVKRCYIASQGEHNSHGDTAQEALLDLRFKVAQVDYDPAELVDEIKARGAIRWHEFRLLTGACAEGLREGLKGLGYAPDLEEMPLPVALKMVRGNYGDARMAELFA